LRVIKLIERKILTLKEDYGRSNIMEVVSVKE